MVVVVSSSNGGAAAGWTGSTAACEGRKRFLVSVGGVGYREWRRRTGFVEILWSGDFGFDKRRERSSGWCCRRGLVESCRGTADVYRGLWGNLLVTVGVAVESGFHTTRCVKFSRGQTDIL